MESEAIRGLVYTSTFNRLRNFSADDETHIFRFKPQIQRIKLS